MPADLQGAADLLGQLMPSAEPTDTSEQTVDQAFETRVADAIADDDAEAAAPVATDDEVVKAAPTPAELRVKEMQERLSRLQESRKNDTRKRDLEEATRRTQALEKQLAEREAAAKRTEETHAANERTWRDSLKDPIAAYKKLGVNPADAYDALSTAAERANSPEAKEEALRDRLRAELSKEYEPRFAELAEMKAQLAQFHEFQSSQNHRLAENAKQQAEHEFYSAATGNGNEVLADYYERDELIQLGHALADEFVASKTPFTVKDIADELRTRLEAQLTRAEQNRARRTATPPANASPQGAKVEKGAASKPDVIGNSTGSSVATGLPKRLTPEQRRVEAARMLATAGF